MFVFNRRALDGAQRLAEPPIPFTYRADIQLLRAFAVLIVVAYHLRLPGFANGFLGVDVFFVVSGFLMQKLHGPDDTAKTFWRRRAARLLPAYFATLAASVIVSLFVVLPDATAMMRDQVIAAGLFASNLLHWTGQSYFVPSEFTPLLHFWSLALELQFYLLFPFVVLFARRWPAVLWIAAAGSFVLCLAVLQVSPKTGFFMLPLRFWEFAIGMLVALHVREEKSHLMAAAGFVLLAGLMAAPLAPNGTGIVAGHPSLAALGACVATAMILAGGIASARLQGRVARAFVAIGDRSYSLYLVHFPLIVFYYYEPFSGTLYGEGDLAKLPALLAMMAVATELLFRSVERRRLFTWRRAGAAASATAAVAMIMPFAAMASYSEKERNFFRSLEIRDVDRCPDRSRFASQDSPFCALIDHAQESDRMLLLGDSHSEMLLAGLSELAQARGFDLLVPADRSYYRSEPEAIATAAQAQAVDRVLIVFRQHQNEPSAMASLAERLRAGGISVQILVPVPERFHSMASLSWPALRDGDRPALTRSVEEARSGEFRTALFQLDGVEVIDPLDALCEGERCPLVTAGGQSLYWDGNHLTHQGADRVVALIGEHTR